MQAGAMSPDNRSERIIDDRLHNAIAGEEALPFGGDDEGKPRPLSGLVVYDAVINLLYGERAAYDTHLSMPNFKSFDSYIKFHNDDPTLKASRKRENSRPVFPI